MTDDVLGGQSSEGRSFFLIGTLGILPMFEETPDIIVPVIVQFGIFDGDKLNMVAVGWFVLLWN